MKKFILFWMLSVVTASAQQGAVLVSTEPDLATRAAEQKQFEYRKKALELQPPGPQRDTQVKQEIQRHLAENKRISMQEQALRKEAISELKQKWTKVESDWKTECTRHDARKQQLENLPDGPAKTAQIEAENAAHRSTSKQIAVERNVVHEGVMKQANREVMGGQTGTSNGVKQTAGTTITDPNHRGMNGDFDAGGGYRTTEKAGKILNEIGVKGPNGGPVKVTGGVLETAPEFGMTVNAAPGADRVGSAGHQSQVKVGAQHAETYVSETGGAMKGGPLKDHVATMDHAKKAMHGLEKPPGEIVGGAPDGQAMAKGALKAANQAGLDPEMVKTIAAKNGIKNPDGILEKLGDIKTGRSTIPNAEEAAKLQKTTRDILDAAETKTKTAAAAEVQAKQSQIADLEAKGMKAQSQQLRNEVADYNAKAKVTTETIRGPAEPVTKPGPASSKPSTTVEPEAKVSGGSKLISSAGLILGIYGIYEGYGKAKEEMEAKKQGEPQGSLGWTKDKAELAGRTFWHGLGFGGMAEIGTQAGKDAFDQYKKDIAAGKISPNDWKPYLQMKGTALAGGLFAAGKAMTYDAAKQSGTNLGNAIGEGVDAGKGLFGMLKSARNEQKTNEERSKEIYDKLIKNGASTMGAQRAADAVKKGDYTEAKRLNKIIEGKLKAKLAATELQSRTRTFRDRKKLAMKREAGKQEQKVRENATANVINLRETVIAKLKAKELPTGTNLVDGLVRVMEEGGISALDAAIAEMTNMQGNFTGSINGRGVLRITVKGTLVSGSWTNSATGGNVTATSSAKVQGDLELSSGTISMKMSGETTVGGKTQSTVGGSFSGSFTGKGYKGTHTSTSSVYSDPLGAYIHAQAEKLYGKASGKPIPWNAEFNGKEPINSKQ